MNCAHFWCSFSSKKYTRTTPTTPETTPDIKIDRAKPLRTLDRRTFFFSSIGLSLFGPLIGVWFFFFFCFQGGRTPPHPPPKFFLWLTKDSAEGDRERFASFPPPTPHPQGESPNTKDRHDPPPTTAQPNKSHHPIPPSPTHHPPPTTPPPTTPNKSQHEKSPPRERKANILYRRNIKPNFRFRNYSPWSPEC